MEKNKENTITTEQITRIIEEMKNQNPKSPTNTIAHVFNCDNKELFISDWLAYILDPNNVNSLEPLNALLECADAEKIDEFTDFNIEREYTFDNNKRIDLYIEIDDRTIVIENKIWSDLSNNQLKEYSGELKNKNAVKILLYPKDNNSKNIIQTQKDNHLLFGFIPILFEDLTEKFKTIRLDFTKDLRPAFFMQDFILHMEEYIMSDSKENLDFESIKLINKNKEALKQINKNILASKKQFNEYIRRKLQDKLNRELNMYEWIVEGPDSCNYFQIRKSNWINSGVHFEILKKDKEEFPIEEYGIYLHACETNRNSELRTLQKAINESVRANFFRVDYNSEDGINKSTDNLINEMYKFIKSNYKKIDKKLKDLDI